MMENTENERDVPSSPLSVTDAATVIPELPADPNFTGVTVRAPPGFSANHCFGLLTLADKRVSTNATNIAKLYKGSLSMKSRMLDLERMQNKGMVKIDGKRLPPRAPREHLISVVRHLAKKYLNIRIHPHDIGSVFRMNAARKSPILIKFLSTHSESVLYQVTDPYLRQKMAKDGIFWSRFQVQSDHQIFRVSTKLRRAGFLFNQFIDQYGVTNIIMHDGDHPVPIKAMSEFADHFQGNEEILSIVDQNSTVQAEDDVMEVVGPLPYVDMASNVPAAAAAAPVEPGALAAAGPAAPVGTSASAAPLTVGKQTDRIIDIP